LNQSPLEDETVCFVVYLCRFYFAQLMIIYSISQIVCISGIKATILPTPKNIDIIHLFHRAINVGWYRYRAPSHLSA